MKTACFSITSLLFNFLVRGWCVPFSVPLVHGIQLKHVVVTCIPNSRRHIPHLKGSPSLPCLMHINVSRRPLGDAHLLHARLNKHDSGLPSLGTLQISLRSLFDAEHVPLNTLHLSLVATFHLALVTRRASCCHVCVVHVWGHGLLLGLDKVGWLDAMVAAAAARVGVVTTRVLRGREDMARNKTDDTHVDFLKWYQGRDEDCVGISDGPWWTWLSCRVFVVGLKDCSSVV